MALGTAQLRIVHIAAGEDDSSRFGMIATLRIGFYIHAAIGNVEIY